MSGRPTAPVAALVALVAAAGCGATAYEAAHERWTRHAAARRDVDTVIDAWATLKADDWRAAYVGEKARRARLGDARRGALEAEQRAAAADAYEVELIVTTYHYSWNDFARPTRSMWRVTLVGDGGRQVEPTRIEEDHRPRGEIRSWFPQLGPFHRAFVIRFPKTAADGAPLAADERALRLRIGGSLGSIEVAWR